MARGSIIWRCKVCGSRKKKCEHKAGRYVVIYQVERWDAEQRTMVKTQKWDLVKIVGAYTGDDYIPPVSAFGY